jgi:hypothetical protein
LQAAEEAVEKGNLGEAVPEGDFKHATITLHQLAARSL